MTSGSGIRQRWRGRAGLSLLMGISAGGWLLLGPAAPLRADFNPATVFNLQCAGCHSVGRGVVVGPDLAGVTARRERRWLHSFIRSSQTLVQAGDAVAVSLFRQYKKRMPDHDFTEEQIDALLAYIRRWKPGEGEVRHARTARRAEVARGRDLFTGARVFARGGAACAGCHAAGDAGRWRGGSLASDLTRVYLKYQDDGLTRALTEPRFPMMEAYHDRPLTADEAFALKAFLYHAARSPAVGDEPFAAGFLSLGFGGSSLGLWLTHRARRRRGGARG
jgi:mono/diheme cytochrome c family protein